MFNSRSLYVRGLGMFAFVVLVAPALFAQSVFINEFHYDNTGADTGEFVEIAGPAGTDLSTYAIELYNGSGGARYDTDALTGIIPNQQNGFGTVLITYPADGIQNGSPDGIALVNGTTVIQFLSYEGAFTATSGTASGMASTDIGVSEPGTTPIGNSLQLQGIGSRYENFSWAAPSGHTRGLPNTAQTFVAPLQPALSIDDVSVLEGDAGTTSATFTVSLSIPALAGGVSFDISTQDGTATVLDSDYVGQSLIGQVIPAGSSQYSFSVTVNGDAVFEPNETFFVNVTNVFGATVQDGQGRGTISNDEAFPVVISQIYGGGGNSGAPFTNDYIELFNRSTSTVSLAGFSVQYASSSGTTWQVTSVSGSLAPGQYYLVQEAAGGTPSGSLPTPDAIGTIAMSATAGKVALVGQTSALAGGCPAAVLDLVGYGSATCFEGSGPTSAPSNSTAILRVKGGCVDTNNNRPDFGVASPAPRNTNSAFRDCSLPPLELTIPMIQGEDAASPFESREVATMGVITALKRGGSGTNGFFVQDTTGDGDSETSDGLFVFTSTTPPVAVGDSVRVVGSVTEFFNLTQITALPFDITVLNSGVSLPDAIALTTDILDPNGTTDQLERFEGMRMQAASLTTIAPTDDFGEIHTVLSGVERPLREPGIEISRALPPGAPPLVPRFDENPERLLIDPDGQPGTTPLNLTSGVTLSEVEGPLDFSFGRFKLLPDSTPEVSPNMSATPVPLAGAAEFTVGSINLENFFVSSSNFAQRLNKASLAIRTIMRSPDIIGCEEVGDLATLQSLAAKLNADAAIDGTSPNYEAFLFESDDDSEADIDVGFLVKRSRVGVVSVSQQGRDETYINPLNGQPEILNDRAPLVLRAELFRPESVFPFPVTVIVNHLRSLIDVDQDPGDGPRVREKRRKQAEFLAGLIQSFQSGDVVSVGDYNAFQFNDGYVDVIGTIKGSPTSSDEVVLPSPDLVEPNLVDLVDTIASPQKYSFVFEGNAQVLDHVLVNSSMFGLLNGFAYARNNADFPESFGLDSTRPERVSDHDMPVAFFEFPDVPGSLNRVEDELSAIVIGNPGTELADKIEDVLDKVRRALEKWSANDRQGAAGEIEGAIGDLEAAHKDGLLSDADAKRLLNALTGAAWLMARQAIEAAEARGGDPGKISEARTLLSQGDSLAGESKFKDAAAKYKDALSKAQGA